VIKPKRNLANEIYQLECNAKCCAFFAQFMVGYGHKRSDMGKLWTHFESPLSSFYRKIVLTLSHKNAIMSL